MVMPTIRPTLSQLSRPMPSRHYILEYGRPGKHIVAFDGCSKRIRLKEVLLVRTVIHGLQRDFRHTLAELGASPASNDGLELLEVRHDNDIRAMRLLLDALEEARPLPVVILAGFVRKDEVNTPQCRRRRPAHLLVLARAFVVENAMDSVRQSVAIYKG